jgi:hypothetical protein
VQSDPRRRRFFTYRGLAGADLAGLPTSGLQTGLLELCGWRGPASASSARPPAPAGLLEFGGGLAEQAPGHDQQLNLLGALEEVKDLGVASPLLEELALGVAAGAA